MNQIISAEKLIEKLNINVYPITLVKFLLNKKRILGYFSKASKENFNARIKYSLDYSNCHICEEKKDQDILCRQHTSIQRVINADNVGFDLDTNTYLYKNEIFKKVGEKGDKLVIVYCPHPKLIAGDITDIKVRKIIPITIEDKDLQLPIFNKMQSITSSDLMNQNIKCWFNKDFSIMTLPHDRHSQNWCLIPNK